MTRPRVIVLSLLAAGVLAVMSWPVLGGRFAVGFLAGMLLALGLPIAGLHLLASSAARRTGDDLRPPELPRPQQVWDYVLSARSLEGDLHDFTPARGREVLVLNFWATWCPPCVAEMPSLERLAGKVSGQPVRILCLSNEPAEQVRAFVQKRGFKLAFLVMDHAPPEIFAHRSIPATFIIDKQAAVAMRHRGAARWDADTIVAYVGELARRPAGTSE